MQQANRISGNTTDVEPLQVTSHNDAMVKRVKPQRPFTVGMLNLTVAREKWFAALWSSWVQQDWASASSRS
jgi:hypothetical protein